MSWNNGYRNNNNLYNSSKGQLADFSHASELYIKNNYRLTPNSKFLYHCVFNVNQAALAKVGIGLRNYLNGTEINMLCKSAELPSFNISTDTKNQYNRKKIVQTKLSHNPVRFRFHDDRAGVILALWEAYYRYYYKDPSYAKYTAGNQPDNVTFQQWSNLDTYEVGTQYRYGFDTGKKDNVPFFNSITINVLSGRDGRSIHTSYTLINPVITAWDSDEVSQESSDFMEATMGVEYESVVYNRGNTTRDNPAGFADPSHYDTTPSPLYNPNQDNLYPYLTPWGKVFEDIVNGDVGLDTVLQVILNLQNSEFATANNSVPAVSNNSLGFSIPKNTNLNFGNQVVQNNLTASPTVSKADLVNSLTNNPAALNNYAFLTEFSPGANGGFNERRAEWDALPAGTKAAFEQNALNKLR